MTDRLIRLTTALVVLAVACVAAIISYRHAYELVTDHGESGRTARLVPLTLDGLIWAASMVTLDANRRNRRVPLLARWSLGVGIAATIGANLAHGLSHGPVGALVSAWPALALVGSYELLMTLVRVGNAPTSAALTNQEQRDGAVVTASEQAVVQEPPPLEQVVRSMYQGGTSQRAIARELGIDRRKVKRLIEATR